MTRFGMSGFRTQKSPPDNWEAHIVHIHVISVYRRVPVPQHRQRNYGICTGTGRSTNRVFGSIWCLAFLKQELR